MSTRSTAAGWKLLVNDPGTAPHTRGVIAIDDSGDRKDGTATAHVGWQWLGRYGETDNGIVTVTTVWADERLYHPLHAEPYPVRSGRRRVVIWLDRGLCWLIPRTGSRIADHGAPLAVSVSGELVVGDRDRVRSA
jgi:hypothetical protein